MPTTPSPVTALDGVTAPSRSDATNFRPRGDAMMAAFAPLIAQLLALASTAYTNAVEAAASAITAVANANAPLWVSGTTYTLGQCAWSPASRFVYRRVVAGAGATDPSADTTNWALANPAQMVVISVAGATQTAVAGARYRLKYAGAAAVTLSAAPAEGDRVSVSAANGRTDNTINPNGKLIGGVAGNLTLAYAGETVDLCYDSVAGSWEITNV